MPRHLALSPQARRLVRGSDDGPRATIFEKPRALRNDDPECAARRPATHSRLAYLLAGEHPVPDKSLKRFARAQFPILTTPPHPRFNDESPLCLCLIIAPGVRGFMGSLKKVSNFCRRLIGRFDKSVQYFLDCS